MKKLFICLMAVLCSSVLRSQDVGVTDENMRSLHKQIDALLEGFAKGDAHRVASLHHPNIVKYFGGNQVVTGRADLEKGLTEWFAANKVEFTENKVESTAFYGETAIQVSIFAIRSTPKNGGEPVIARGRSMVIYVKDKSSPTGWLSLREMTQAAPENK